MDTAFWKELKTHVPAATYKVIQRDRKMHAVNDVLTGTMAYAVFEDTKPAADNVFSFLPAETMVMYQKENNALVMSVCTPRPQHCGKDIHNQRTQPYHNKKSWN